MRKKITLILMILFQGFVYPQNNTLDIFSSGGGNFSGSSMQQSWTLGEAVTETFSGQHMKITQGFQQSDLFRKLEGKLTYDNSAQSPLFNANISLYRDSVYVSQTTTDDAGFYEFQFLPNGNYYLLTQSGIPWGGTNAIDALLITRHFTELINLSGIRLNAADVNTSGTVNSVDALQVMRRFVGLQGSFSLADWIFEQHTITIDGLKNRLHDFKGICAGDVDGSYIPEEKK